MQASLVGRPDALKAPTDLGTLYDGAITGSGYSQGAGGAELCARPLQVLRDVEQQRLANSEIKNGLRNTGLSLTKAGRLAGP
jgi:hypothetical protein